MISTWPLRHQGTKYHEVLVHPGVFASSWQFLVKENYRTMNGLRLCLRVAATAKQGATDDAMKTKRGIKTTIQNLKSQIKNLFHPIRDKHICIMSSTIIAVAAENDFFAIR